MPLRDLVLSEIRAQGGVVSAYALAGLLSAERRRRIAPNSVYRVLNDLIARDCVRRVEYLNGFIASPEVGGSMIAICNHCDRIFWLDDEAVNAQLRHVAESKGFKVTRLVIEVIGSCETCSQQSELSRT
jgi:Fur family transcriptional regulator, zinc uptake regulator